MESKLTFKISLFLTPQCQYKETAGGDISIKESFAVATMHVATGEQSQNR